MIEREPHSCEGRCSGRLRLLHGLILREIVCDDCDALVETLSPLPYSVPERVREVAA